MKRDIQLLEEAVKLSFDCKQLYQRKAKLIEQVSNALNNGEITKEVASEIDNIADLKYFKIYKVS